MSAVATTPQYTMGELKALVKAGELKLGIRCPACGARGRLEVHRGPKLRVRCDQPTCRVVLFEPGVPL